ncbi:cell wall-active antibiotics response protein LiaF [Solibacillus sp. FSL H8-0538]|uniref:cell wall-active antibiotics response protein LiaF n=1 Tax=Solibacillus sp. FSL H8-0538 TaxID=2921400 RepID=UPI0030FA15F3
MTKFSTDQLSFLVISFLLIVLVELTIFNNGGVFLLIFGAGLTYFGVKKSKRTMFWIGIILMLFALLSLWTLRLFVIGLLIYLLYKLQKKSAEVIELNKEPLQADVQQATLIGTTSSPLDAYKWKDVQIQRFIGDITIDATQTILPVGKSVISIQQALGKVRVIIPYEVPVRLHYTTIYGEATCLRAAPKRLFNEQLQFEDGDLNAKRELVIYVATWIGDVEVQRA